MKKIIILHLLFASCQKEQEIAPLISPIKTTWTLSISIPSEGVNYTNLTAVKVGTLEDGYNNEIGYAIRFEKDGFIILFFRLFDGTTQQINGSLDGQAFGLVHPKTTLGFCNGGQNVEFTYSLTKN